MKKIMIIFAAMMLSLFGGKAMAQRTLPGMKSVEVAKSLQNVQNEKSTL